MIKTKEGTEYFIKLLRNQPTRRARRIKYGPDIYRLSNRKQDGKRKLNKTAANELRDAIRVTGSQGQSRRRTVDGRGRMEYGKGLVSG